MSEAATELNIKITDPDEPVNRNFRPVDQLTGFDVDNSYQRFDQKNDVFCRSEWDPEVRSKRAVAFYQSHYMPNAKPRKADGFSQLDYALRNAAWHVTNVVRDIRRESDDRKEGFLDSFTAFEDGWPEPYAFASKAEATANIKKAARFIGAGLFGVCENDSRWLYASRYSEKTQQSKPIDIPEDIPNVIVIGEPMDKDLIMTVPSALSGAATGKGYTHDTVVLLSLTQYIRNLGYEAHATMNDSSLAIPLAVQAGLGEVGRHSLLITPEYGPRLRLGKIYTNMPLEISDPIKFGVKEFCDICQRCSTACPPKAITPDPPSRDAPSISNLRGIKKWTTVAEKCFAFWAGQNSDCSICVRICPYNRDFSRWYNRVWRKLAGTRFRKLMLWLDVRFHPRIRSSARKWWKPI